MAEITRCPVCAGRKTLLSLGGMVKNCYKCSGIGHIKLDEPEKVVCNDKIVKVRRKAGRPKRDEAMTWQS